MVCPQKPSETAIFTKRMPVPTPNQQWQQNKTITLLAVQNQSATMFVGVVSSIYICSCSLSACACSIHGTLWALCKTPSWPSRGYNDATHQIWSRSIENCDQHKEKTRKWVMHTKTHTHMFNGPFTGTTRVSQYQKGKTSVDFTESRDSEWQWHQLGHMQVCTSLQTNTPAPHHSVFTGWMPFLPPNQQRQSTEGN